MKRIFIFVLFISTSLIIASAQEVTYNKVKAIEVEPLLGINFGNKVSHSPMSGYLGAEIRLNYPGKGFDVGIQFSLGAMDQADEGYGIDYHIRYRSITTFVGYNYRKWKNITPFAGVGLGAAFIQDELDYRNPEQGEDSTSYPTRFSFVPRIGVEFFNHYRLTFEYRFIGQKYSTFNIAVGVAFGGGPRSK